MDGRKESKHSTYEKTANRTILIRIASAKSDTETDLENWDKIKSWLSSKGDGNMKKGLLKLAEENGIFE